MSERTELWVKHRPTSFADIVGQDAAVKLLEGYLANDSVPHAILFTGSTGCGKTTMAHILANRMGCGGNDKVVINCAATEKSLDTVREVQFQAKTSPIGKNRCRVWIWEELQAWARAGFAQEALLLMLEDPSVATKDSYFFFCTTNPEKVKATVKGRCKKVELKSLSNQDMLKLLKRIVLKEGREVSGNVLQEIVSMAEGSPRNGINHLDTVLAVGGSDDNMLEALADLREQDYASQLVKALMWEKVDAAAWKKVADLIQSIPDGKDESFRHRILATAATECLKGGRNHQRAHFIAEVFAKPWYDCKESGLVYCCGEILQPWTRK